jgi:hypothetical protein
MAYDRFETCLQAVLPGDPRTGRFSPVDLRINGRSLLELIRELEVPLVRKEVEERLAGGEPPEAVTLEPGGYLPLPAHLVFLPSRHLLDQPQSPGFVLEPDDPQRGKTRLLGCTCGVSECWMLTVRVELSADEVRWSDFTQFHRQHWRYDLGPFVFRRVDYERALTAPGPPGR